MFQDPLAVFPAARSCLAGALSDRTRNSQQRVVAKSAQGKPGDYYKSTYTTIANGCQGLIWGEKTPMLSAQSTEKVRRPLRELRRGIRHAPTEKYQGGSEALHDSAGQRL